jgi:hypothetical protein
MLRKTTTTLLLSLASAGALITSSSPPAPPIPGPHGVIAAVKEFVRALDAGDAKALAAVFGGGYRADFWSEDAEGKGRQVTGPNRFAFCDVGADGRAIVCTSVQDFTETLARAAGPSKERKLASRLIEIRADCASKECSYAIADVERVYRDGDEVKTQLVRATALLNHDESRFRVYHWHASPLPAAQGSRKD